ncbi:MAG: lipoate--protein ligase family protein [Planctomycetes bacterium]|nr:lipoate--protein ligase family protein [Planctomycetota bacterium]
MKWRLLIDEKGTPAQNMAVDEAMLMCFDPAFELPTLRLYGWSPAAISIGYFQPAHSAAVPDYPVFRRITGGGAICHDGDFTYSVVVGRGDSITRPSLYNAIHEAMSNALHQLNVAAKPRWVAKREDSPIDINGTAPRTKAGQVAMGAGGIQGEGDDLAAIGTAMAALWQSRHSPAPFFCSGREAEADLVVGEKKILGSAQRRSRRAILQHGSMPIRDTACDGQMTSVRREAKRKVKFEDVVPAVTTAFESVFGVSFERGQLSEEEQKIAVDLVKQKYGNSKWNYRR